MFEDLNWKSAARRSAVVIAIYLGLLYLLSVAFPDSSFNMDSRSQIISLFVNAIIFFFIFTFVYAFVERSRNRRIAEARKQKKPAKQATGNQEAEDSSLKGRPNPNTSRKKTRRRR
jgi:phosphotransferase system  glucose/maltose/N-acetylglucosamine-specific IIC component